ncbi:hypothetical protein [Providencia rettgeri]|uniref:hypothetical protein n=1 Tax=Providencia rettgeri TaxID=587 RepID=UPI0025733C44|nr:hypothetical protein [Providencia rettgeri]MDL9985956.1 hypothetical protein [Providencia rettgeri]
MAKYSVVNYVVTRKPSGNGFDYIELRLNLLNSSGNPKSVAYTLHEDTRHTLVAIENTLNNGLHLAQSESISIEIGEFLERAYIFVTLPVIQGDGKIKKEQNQYTAHKI